MAKIIRIHLRITEKNGSNKKNTPIVERTYISTDSNGDPCFFYSHKAVRDMLYKLIEWNMTTQQRIVWDGLNFDPDELLEKPIEEKNV